MSFASRIIALFLCVFLVPLVRVPADSVSPKTIDRSDVIDIQTIRVGVEGIYKSGLWTPIRIFWKSSDPELVARITSTNVRNGSNDVVSISSVDSDGTPVTYRSVFSPHVFQESRPQEVRQELEFESIVYAKLGRRNAPLSVSVEIDGFGHAVKTFHPQGNPARQNSVESTGNRSRFMEPVPAERPVYLLVGNEDIGLQGAIAELSLREDRRPMIVKVSKFSELPEYWFGYEAVEMVVLTTTEPEQFEGLTGESSQIKALDQWIRLGGRLFFCAGKESGRFLENEDGPLRSFLPGRFERMTDLRDGKPLELFVSSNRRIALQGSAEAPYLEMPYFTEPRGIVFVSDLNLPLVSRCAHGFGTIVYFGGDLSGRPMQPWRDRVQLVRAILQWNTEKRLTTLSADSLIQLGYNDISGQVRSALDRHEGVRVVPFSMILIILVMYWLAVGPADWFFVHKILKRPALTWLTFPVWIVLFCVLAYCLAAPGRPDKTLLHQFDLIDIDAESGALRVTQWGNIYSPNDRRYTLGTETRRNFQNDSDFLPVLFSWNGLPGSGLGGMAPKTVSPTVWQEGSHQWVDLHGGHLASSIDSVPIPVRSTKSFFGQCWDTDSSGDSVAVVSRLRDEEGVPVGFLEMPETLPNLENVALVYGRWAIFPGDVEAGKKIDIGKNTPRRELRDLLVPLEILEDESLRRLASRYNMQSADLEYIARVLSLHNALGGYDSVGLYNSFQRSLDLSDLLSVDRVLLIGTVRRSEESAWGTSIRINDFNEPKGASKDRSPECRHTIVVRQTLPIELVPGISPRLGIGRVELQKDVLEQMDKPAETRGGAGGYESGIKAPDAP